MDKEEEKKTISKKRTGLVCLISLGAAVLILTFIFSWNAGLFLPSGFVSAKNSKAICPVTKHISEFTHFGLASQFIEINSPADENNINFIHADEKYFLQAQNDFRHILPKATEELVGSFAGEEKIGRNQVRFSHRFIFLYDNYLYYSQLVYI